ncbi:LacI family DNA-binding transcriptional regulator [Oerskovia flava]|uniref:LacI family DNA-binding transcriptional regulator n=1 Tax=Oerskovia flava TaxID=2986422 RepID=UPI002AD2C3EB|nr:LacI family DNA-binding transcriptional regulator [Oerskovia sp. JB1-3-2]
MSQGLDEVAPERRSAQEDPGAASAVVEAHVLGEVRPERRRRRVSMADVARLAGVSSQTVSRVANGHPGVVDETRRLVLGAMAELGYRPNSAARALKSGEFRTIGVILFTLSTTGNVRTLEAIASSAAAEGYAITLIPVAVPTQDGVRGAFTRLGELAVDAVILLMEVHLLDAASVSLPPGVQVVVADSDAGDQYSVVDTDQADGTRQAVAHLLDLGHRTVHHLAGPEESFAAERRTAAWRRTLEEAGCPVLPVERGDWSAESGYRAGLRLAADPACTAVFAANDELALGLLRALHESGRRVPEDVSVVGFDDISEAGSFLPPLTTVHQDFAEVGRRCVEGVLRQFRNDEHERGTHLVPTHLVVRRSTGPAPR